MKSSIIHGIFPEISTIQCSLAWGSRVAPMTSRGPFRVASVPHASPREMTEELLLPTIVSYSFAVESCEQATSGISGGISRVDQE